MPFLNNTSDMPIDQFSTPDGYGILSTATPSGQANIQLVKKQPLNPLHVIAIAAVIVGVLLYASKKLD